MIVGTAGHVDHGKTTLVRALTGIDTDRLKEEKARGITIDLGFAYMPAPDGVTIGFVDMPGHESLVRTMVAGAAGIDFALLIVAADEGIMPQTREHLDILDLLGIARGRVVVTKSDRVDAARRSALEHEIASALGSHVFAAVSPLFVSAKTGEGIDALKTQLGEAARQRRPRRDGVFRLAVDRAFTLKGVGTVVTGTALSGRVGIDDEVTLLPGARRARVRSMHVQNQPAAACFAGDRCALALAGVPNDTVARGAWICGDAAPVETTRFDATVRLLASERHSLGQWTPAHLHCGASDVPARVTILSAESLPPGATGIAQIVLSTPLPLRHGDRFVLRDTSAQRTIGGGTVVAPLAPLRKRRTPERLQRLATMAIDPPEAALARLLATAPFAEDFAAFAVDRGLTPNQAATLVKMLDLAVDGEGEGAFVMTRARRREIDEAIVCALAAHHADHPELPGLAGEPLRRSLAPMPPKPLFDALRTRLLAERQIAIRGHWLHLPSHIAQLSVEDQRIADLMLPLIAKDRFRPPRVRDVGGLIGFHETKVRHASKALARSGALIEIATDHFFTRETVAEMADIARDLTAHVEQFTAADFRDRLDNGRKVAIQVLEYFDRHGLTHRDGDLRRVVKSPELVFGDAPPSRTAHAVDRF